MPILLNQSYIWIATPHFDFAEPQPVNNLGQAGRDAEGSACGPKIAGRVSDGFLAGSLSIWGLGALVSLLLVRLLMCLRSRHTKAV